MPMSGIYELFIPGVGDGAVYKYEMKLKGGTIQLKSDPYAVCTELPPASASVVKDLRNYVWDDATWMDARMTATFIPCGAKLPPGKMRRNWSIM